jgi:hypothetical protein
MQKGAFMKTCRVHMFTLASVVLSLALPMVAQADVRALMDGAFGPTLTYGPIQTLTRPAGVEFTRWGTDVAVDGAYIIVLASYTGGQQALLYRRSSDGRWVYRRVLVTYTGPVVRANVAMRNGIAAVQFDDQITLFEISGGDYVPAPSDAPIRHHGGLAISGNSVLIGGDNCDYDAVIYQKGTSGSWGITGRLDDNQGQCLSTAYDYAVELNYDTAILREPNGTEGRAWRRNGSAVNWVPAGTLPFQPGESASVDGAYGLQGATAVAPNGVVWRRSGTSSWTRQGEVISVDHDNGAGITLNVVYRDGVLLTNEPDRYQHSVPHAYVETSAGLFENLAVMPSGSTDGAYSLDVSGRTAVTSWHDYDYSKQLVRVYNLPAPLRAPAPVVNDFEDRNISDLTFSGGQFALATRGSDDVLAQSASNGLAIALANGTDWTDYQRVEADITPTFSGTGSWVGLVARYVDANNYYYLAIRDNDTYGIYKRVNGVDTLLRERPFYNTHGATYRASLRVTGATIETRFSFQGGDIVKDSSLPHGRGGVATWLARADFDDLHVAATEQYFLLQKDYSNSYGDRESGMHELSGTWEIREEGDEEVQWLTGLSQLDASGSAVAIVGTPVANQEINTSMRVDAFAASGTGAYVGLLARYVDPKNHYYVTMRATGQIQIKKIVNGVITILASSNFTPVIGNTYRVRFLVINDQLQLYVDDALVGTAHDRDIASGMYGVETYRAKATWDSFSVMQP